MNDKKNHRISLQTAIEMTTHYRENRPVNCPFSEAFHVEAVRKLLETEGAAFLRIYYGMKPDGQVHLILVPADAEGQDILPEGGGVAASESEGGILEDAFRCPPFCPGGPPLGER